MNRLVWIVIGLPIAVVVVVLAVVNRHPVTINLDPFSPADPAISFTLPLYVILFATFAVGLASGGFLTWSTQRKWRRLARQRKSELAAAGARLERAQKINSATSLPAPSDKAA